MRLGCFGGFLLALGVSLACWAAVIGLVLAVVA